MWNFRVLAHQTEKEIYLEIHAVYYNTAGKAEGYSTSERGIQGDGLLELNDQIKKMQEATKKPILWAGEQFPKEYNGKKKFLKLNYFL
jgi:maltoporin